MAENAGISFTGETPWTPAVVTSLQAQALEQARNPTGRPNSDVLRRFTGFTHGRPHAHWQVDFSPYSTEQEAALYHEPFRLLRARLNEPRGHWWLNPQARPELRTALARLERYLVTPLALKMPVWHWTDSMVLPDDTLLAVVRDDDLTHGLLSSRIFQSWWSRYAPRLSPAEIVGAFPFPWPPATLLSALTREQEEYRMAITRAARSTDQTMIDSAVVAAYGWPLGLADDESQAKLMELHRQRAD